MYNVVQCCVILQGLLLTLQKPAALQSLYAPHKVSSSVGTFINFLVIV